MRDIILRIQQQRIILMLLFGDSILVGIPGAVSYPGLSCETVIKQWKDVWSNVFQGESLIVLSLGTNDANPIEAMNSLVTLFRKEHPAALLCWLLPRGWGELAEMCVTDEAVVLLDTLEDDEMTFADGIHPDANGRLYLASVLQNNCYC